MCKTTGSLVWLVSDSLAASATDIQVPGLIRQLVFGGCAAFEPAGLLQQDVAGHSTAAHFCSDFGCPQDQHQLVQVGSLQPSALRVSRGRFGWWLPVSAQANAFRQCQLKPVLSDTYLDYFSLSRLVV